MRIGLLLCFNFFFCAALYAQSDISPCSHESIMRDHLFDDPNFKEQFNDTENLLQKIIKERRNSKQLKNGMDSLYIIPVVLHVFHYGEDGKIDMSQAQSGLDILNRDLSGENDGWSEIDPEFDSIKATINLSFHLAQLDPDGEPTTGVLYHEDESLMYNDGDLFQYAWDNTRYLNIYIPKYIKGEPSNFTARAYYPSDSRTAQNIDGIIYSSIRWGIGVQSELSEGDEWTSVITHEVGHWLNLRHTFQGGCIGVGDGVDDTPPTLADGPALEGCYNQDYSCGVRTNGENFMDYNHRCKKMFTRGQIERIEAALYLPSRMNLWSEANLAITGISEEQDQTTSIVSSNIDKSVSVFPNPVSNVVMFDIEYGAYELFIYSLDGKEIDQVVLSLGESSYSISGYSEGIYYFKLVALSEIKTGTFVVAR